MKYADIAVNLTDPMFTGVYHGKTRHQSDLDQVVQRARGKGVERILIMGTSLEESRKSLDLAKRYGVHPTSTGEIGKHPSGSEAYFTELEDLIAEDRGEGGSNRIISVGEIGLDYDRLHWSPRAAQLEHLPRLLSLSKRFWLPLFLHSRTSEAHTDLMRALQEAGWPSSREGVGRGKEWTGGVVHSFTGTKDEVKEIVDMGLYIGINGCSLKTAENLDAVRTIPLDSLVLETDAPWCSITSSHASAAFLPPPDTPLHIQRVNKPDKWREGLGVKGRAEPADVVIIAEVVASVMGKEVAEVVDAAWRNAGRLFWGDPE